MLEVLKGNQVLCGHAPYYNLSGNEMVMLAIIEGVRPRKPDNATHLGFTDVLWDMVKQCWLADWRARPSVEDILSSLNAAPPSWPARRRVIVRKAISVFLGDSS